ncbi:MAG TPA: XRE family transcriptional regulator [Brevibacterium sp.]|nr:XRE family transcriptional regulator [Brevibacterium sp.]
MPRVIGHNVRARRDALGITAATLGQRVGDALGKPWPRQTIYLMESGERAMIAAEVAVLTQILDTTVADLFTPPAEVETVTAGSLTIPAENLSAPVGGDADAAALADDLRALDRSRGEILAAVRAQEELLGNARSALRGDELAEPDTASAVGRYMNATRAAANRFYEDKGPVKFGPMGGEDDGEGE